MLDRRQFIGATVGSALVLGTSAWRLNAATPPDTLVMGWAIDDIISLDPAEVFEFSPAEMLGNAYQGLISYDVNDVSKIFGVVAESWAFAEDGKSVSFKIRDGLKFASGNPITASDAVFSLHRAIKLDKSPAFILGQFGLTPGNVDDMVKKTGDMSFEFHMDKAYAPSFVLYCLTATVGYIVDEKLAMSHEQDGDFGYNWLKTAYAGSGAFTIREWRANEIVVMERNDNYGGPKPAMARAIYRHIPESATQRLLLQQGDIDIARNLAADEITALSSDPNIVIDSGPKGTIYYLGLSQKNEYLKKPEVRQAMKYLVDYSAIADTIMKGRVKVHQAFLPEGFLGALNDNPFSLNIAKAKELLAKAGVPDGFKVTMDTRNTDEITGMAQAIQQTMAKAGIEIEIIPGDGQQTLTKYRARNHDIYIGRWGPDYQDPNTNASTFAYNPDNSDGAKEKPLAWRNSWDIPDLSKETVDAALERDTAKRAAIYEDLQKKVEETGPFVVMFQEIEVMGRRKDVNGFVIGPSFNDNSFRAVTKA